MTALDQFHKQKYLNLETFRKNGESMKTPVWFIQEGETIYVVAMANSGKVKRIRNCGTVNIAPCKMDGKPVGKWVPAEACEIKDAEKTKVVNHLLDRKYGLLKKMFAGRRTSEGVQDTILEIKIFE
jgi:PPOX class probable F420-dependent enzyme